MKQISQTLKDHLAGELTSLVTCWLITRRDGVRLAFTTHDKVLTFDNLTFHPVNSFLPSTVSSSNGLNVDNLEVSAILSTGGMSEKDIRAGRYDYARISIFQVNWQQPTAGKLYIRSGWLGEFVVHDHHFTVEIRGLTQKLQQTIGGVFSPECRANLGAEGCHVNLEFFSSLGRVTSVIAADHLEDATRTEADSWFDYGLIRWISGPNAGQKSEIKSFAAGAFVIFDPPAEPIAIGDIYIARAGCDKRAVTCKSKFQNFVNFKAETAIPGTDSLYNYPGLK